jgi:hypothetical protein
MFNIEEVLAEYGLTPERYEELLKECSDKVHKISDSDWSEISSKYGIDMNPDTLRKAQQPPLFGGVFVREYYQWKESQNKYKDDDSYMKEIQIQKDEIYKEKRKLYDQRREYNKLLTSDARSEHLTDEMILAANRLNESRPLEVEEKWITVNTKKEAVLVFSDWHYGMVTDNLWNKYNTDICRERVAKLVAYTKEYLQLNKIDMLHLCMLGDAAHGSIHTTCRVKSEEDTCDQIMNVAEIIAEAINELSTVVNHVTVYSCYGNHLRTVQNKKDSIDSDNLEKMIPWWLKQRLQKNFKVDIVDSEYKEFTKLNVLGYNICCVHGNLDNFKNLGTTVNTIFSRKFGETIDYTISGDKHHLEEFEQFDIESILVRSLCGTDDYANEHRLYSKAGQTLLIFNNEYGREATYHIPLN